MTNYNGMPLEALEIQYQDSDEFRIAYDTWEMDSLPEYGCLGVSPLDLFLSTNEYKRGLNSYAEAWNASQSDEWDTYDTPESDEALRLWDEHHRSWSDNHLVRLFRRVVGK